MNTTLKVGLIGLGAMGRNHARVLNKLPGVRLVAAYDTAADRTKAVNTSILLQSIQQFKTKNLDYCVIAVPTIYHADVALPIINMGINVLIEKPISHDITSAIQIQQALKNNQLLGAVGQIERYNPALIKAKQLVQQGLLGHIYQVSTTRQNACPKSITYTGVVDDLATHDIDLTIWLTQLKYQQITAITAHALGSKHEDIASITAQMQQGIIANHNINRLNPHKIRQTHIVGQQGCLIADTLNTQLSFYPNKPQDNQSNQIIHYQLDHQQPLISEHQAFRDYILGQNDNIATIQSSIQVLQICQAALQSAKTGNTVPIP